MFVGHYAAALAAKTVEPRAPLWSYVAACQLVDIGWSGLVMAGVEKVRIDPALPGSPLDLYFMPYTHSLAGALAWSVAGAVLARYALRLPWRAGIVFGLAVFSHWILDLLVHRPDLDLGFGAGKVGLGLWNYPIPEMTLEMGLVAVAGAAWAAARKAKGRTAWPAVLFVGILAAVQIAATFAGAAVDVSAMGASALAVYGLVCAIAWGVDRSTHPGLSRTA